MEIAIEGHTVTGTVPFPQRSGGYPLQALVAQIGSEKIRYFWQIASRGNEGTWNSTLRNTLLADLFRCINGKALGSLLCGVVRCFGGGSGCLCSFLTFYFQGTKVYTHSEEEKKKSAQAVMKGIDNLGCALLSSA